MVSSHRINLLSANEEEREDCWGNIVGNEEWHWEELFCEGEMEIKDRVFRFVE